MIWGRGEDAKGRSGRRDGDNEKEKGEMRRKGVKRRESEGERDEKRESKSNLKV